MKMDDAFELWGRLIYLGLDGEGNLHLIIRKRRENCGFLRRINESFVGEKVKITIKRMRSI